MNPALTPGERFDFCADYCAPPEVYDEMCSAPGSPRPHWDYVIRALGALGTQELGRRAQEARRLLRDNGVTYNVYHASRGEERPWVLDPIPVLLTSQEWSTVETGLSQRAELLNLILADLYGPKRLMRQGLLPPELVYSHPGFLLPCEGIRPTSERYLSLYTADLARAPSGSFWVIGDRTQAPSGAGYALENRVVLSRVLPSLYRDAQVHRLALFFRTLRATLAAMAPRSQDNPRIVLLTPGPGNETYFEHAYLAQYLDYTLVQGGDLTVRDGRVWLKTLDGLQPVEVILRRVDDTFCDPLELRKDSLLGTPGLVQAARLKQIAIANPLGSGVLENPGLMAFLPGIARYLLGEELRIPSVATWWCGTKQECSYVLAHLERLVIKPIFPHPSTSTIFGARLSAKEREVVAENIRAHPRLFIGQEPIALSTTPVLVGDRLEPRPMVLRSFLVARDDAYVAMPGGLTRVSPSMDTWIVSNQAGGVSKDTWVLASEPERQVSLLSLAERSLSLTRSGDEVPSRVADDLFWLGRYGERTEGGARVLREVLLRLLDTESAWHDAALPALLTAVTHRMVTYVGVVGEGAERRLTAVEHELLGVIADAERTGSLRFHLNALIRAGRSVRDRLSNDTSRVLSSLDQELRHARSLSEALESLERLIIGLASFTGLSSESMSRGQSFRFMEIGRRLERALYTISLLRAVCELPPAAANSGWGMVLAVTDSLMTYSRRYRAHVEAGAVLDLLLHDEHNPRSVGYQLVRLQEHIAGLPRKASLPYRSAEERAVLEALTALRVADVDGLSRPVWDEKTYDALSQLFARLSALLLTLSDVLTRRYFSHTELPQQLVDNQS